MFSKRMPQNVWIHSHSFCGSIRVKVQHQLIRKCIPLLVFSSASIMQLPWKTCSDHLPASILMTVDSHFHKWKEERQKSAVQHKSHAVRKRGGCILDQHKSASVIRLTVKGFYGDVTISTFAPQKGGMAEVCMSSTVSACGCFLPCIISSVDILCDHLLPLRGNVFHQIRVMLSMNDRCKKMEALMSSLSRPCLLMFSWKHKKKFIGNGKEQNTPYINVQKGHDQHFKMFWTQKIYIK